MALVLASLLSFAAGCSFTAALLRPHRTTRPHGRYVKTPSP